MVVFFQNENFGQRLNNKSEEILKECFLLTYENGENVSLENTINKIGNKFDITDWNNKNIEKEVLEEDMIAKDNYGIYVLNKNLKIKNLAFFLFFIILFFLVYCN